MNALRRLWRRALRLVGLSPGQRRMRGHRQLLQQLPRALLCRAVGLSVYADDAEIEQGRLQLLGSLRCACDRFDLTGARTDADVFSIIEGWKRGAARAAELKQELGIK